MLTTSETIVDEPTERIWQLRHAGPWSVSVDAYPTHSKTGYGPHVQIDAWATINGAILSYRIGLPVDAALALAECFADFAAEFEQQREQRS